MDELDDDSRRDLLVGREKRLRERYRREHAALSARLLWLSEAIAHDGITRKGYPELTIAMFDTDMAGTYEANAARLGAAVRAWIVARDELVAFDRGK